MNANLYLIFLYLKTFYDLILLYEDSYYFYMPCPFKMQTMMALHKVLSSVALINVSILPFFYIILLCIEVVRCNLRLFAFRMYFECQIFQILLPLNVSQKFHLSLSDSENKCSFKFCFP